MSDMDLGIKISSDSGAAVDSVKDLSNVIEELTHVIRTLAKEVFKVNIAPLVREVQKVKAPLKGVGDDAKTLGQRLADAFSSIRNSVGTTFNNVAKDLDSFSKKAKKFGREFTAYITTPIVALAGLSLKKVFDEALAGNMSGSVNTFAAEVQNLKAQWDQLLITIGTQLAPIATRVVSFLSNMITAFQSLSPETKSMITTVGLIAAAIGPVVLGIGAFAGIISKLMVVIGPLIAGLKFLVGILMTPKAIIAGIILSIAGLINVFLKLKQTGESTGQALIDVFHLAVGFLGKYVLGSITTIVSKIISGFGMIAGLVSSDLQKTFQDSAKAVSSFGTYLDENFDKAKGVVDKKLGTMGSSAASAFTFGFSDKISEGLDAFGDMFDEVTKKSGNTLKTINKDIEQAAHQLRVSISGNLATSLVDIAEGAKTAEQAFADFARSTIRQIAQMILQAMIFRALFPAGGPLSQFAGNVASASNIQAPKFASGGFVSGPGSGTSDSIMARLSNGEFVSDAKTVRAFGSDFFHGLKSIARGGVPSSGRGIVPTFADGGLVSSPSDAPQVVIQNSGTPKDVESTTYDPSTAVTTVILQDLQKNGSVAKALQSTFGVRRRGFS